MATRDLTKEFLELRATAIRKRKQKLSHNINASSTGNNGVGSVSGGIVNRFAAAASDGGGGGGTPTNGYRKLAAGGATHDLMLSVNDDNSDGYSDIEMNTLGGSSLNAGNKKPEWVSDVEIVEKCINDITQQMKELQSRHAQRVGSVFGRDLQNMESVIEQQTSIITEQFRTAERLLQKVGYATKRTGGQEATVGANVQRSLAKRLQELSVSFRQSQRRYLAEVQTQKSGGTPSAASKFSMIQLDNNEKGGTNNESTFFTSQQLAVVDDLTSMVQSRDEEIIKIAQSIEELGTIFKELAVLVIDQGTILDRIDYNMEAVVDHTQTGLQQLERAEQSQKNARPLRCIVCLSFTVFALLVILIIKHRPRHGWL